MNSRKCLVFLLAVCTLFAAPASGVSSFAGAQSGARGTAVHALMAADAHSACPVFTQTDDAGKQDSGSLPGYSCCINFVAFVSSLDEARISEGAGEAIAFEPPFALTARHQDIYRPPRRA
ncbi:MAG: hypothetical protein LBU11_00805 [Zoogloeaceae bacterium]|jgi:hypothetical protein|nr:hypothetical protein [Zoogloeaceae bacterium]